MADQDSISIPFPLGRLTGGSLTERTKTDYDGNPYEENKGPFEITLAIPKSDPLSGAALGKLCNHAKAGYATQPTIGQRIDSEWLSGFSIGAFRFKVRDGDKPNQQGSVNANNAGHWVIYLSSYIAFNCTYTDRHGLPKLIDAMGKIIEPGVAIDRALIKIGDYCYVAVGTKVNGKLDHTAGMYMNINGVMLAARGDAITGGISLSEAFKDVQFSAALPPGASVSAMPGTGNAAPVAATMALPGSGAPVGQALPGTAAPGSATVAPHTAFLAGPGSVTGGVGLPLPGQG